MYHMHLSVIIPAKNEEKHIRQTVQSALDYLKPKGKPFEIIVVSNASTDRTVEFVREMGKNHPEVKVIDLPARGKGLAVKEGMLHATGEYRLFMDADNSTTIDHLDTMMAYFEKGYDIVIGSIRVPGHFVGRGSEPWYRIFLGKLSNIYTRVVLLPGISDTQRGFKILTGKAAQDIFSRSKITQFGFDMEMLAVGRMLGYKIKEVPVRWHNDPTTSSHPRLSAYIQVFLDTLRIKRDLLTGKYTHATMAPADIISS